MRLHSHDDFTPLREIIVGSAENYLSHDRDVTFELFHHESLTGFRSDWAYPRLSAANGDRTSSAGASSSATPRNSHEDVENLAATLAALDVTVHRPLPLPPNAAPIAGLGWQAAPTPALNIRDNTLILGDEIIETPPAIRSRYLETRLLAPVFRRYYEAGAPVDHDAPSAPHRSVLRPVLREGRRDHPRRSDRADRRPAAQPVRRRFRDDARRRPDPAPGPRPGRQRRPRQPRTGA